MEIDFNDPLVLGGIALGLALVLVLFLLVFALRASGRAARAAEPLANQMLMMGEGLRVMNESQHVLKGGLDSMTQTQAQAMHTVESRLAHVQQQMQDKLHENAMKSARSLAEMQGQMKDTLQGSSEKTTKSLTQLQERLATIDKAQTNIEKLSGDVLSLQDILSNKQTRGAFGEIQLNDIVQKAMPPDAYTFQATLSNGKRADCLIHLPNPPGPIVIDSKFPLEAYEKIRAADNPAMVQIAVREMKAAVRAHISAISQKYIIEGETAEGALMFLPSEAVYAELHANFGDVVREGFDARVWIVSPTTCMATLNTMRAILKDARMKEQAGAIRKELGLLNKDVDRLETRVGNLDRHFGQAAKDVEDIKISATKAGNRAKRLDAFDFAEIEESPADNIVRIAPEDS
jgi:DNA recombination protein RmuC